MQLFDYFLKAGLAVALPVLTGTFSPIDQEYLVDTSWQGIFSQPPDVTVQWVKELRRTLDYIETRPDIDHDRIAYFGNGIGAVDFPVILALEPRIRVSLTESGALDVWKDPPPPEVDPFHFLPRVRTPIMIVNSRYDFGFPYAASQLPTLEYAGTPAEHKRLVSTETSFPVPNWAVMREAIPWFEKYLGSVEGF